MLIRVPESAGTLYERIQYPAGELQIRLTPSAISTLYGTPRLWVMCREAHKHLMELALLSDAIHNTVPYVESQLVLPYLPYGRADRRFTEGDCHGLRTFGSMVDRMGYHSVKTLDVHSFRAQKNVANLVNVSARPFISKAIADIADRGGHPVVLLPDEGAKRYKLDGALQASKRREAATGKLNGFEVPDLPPNHDVLIVDDICDGGGTFTGLAKEINKSVPCGCGTGYSFNCRCKRRPKKLYLYVTHGIFSRGLTELLQYFEKIYTTDSIPVGYAAIPNGTSHVGGLRLQVYECLPELLGPKSTGRCPSCGEKACDLQENDLHKESHG